MISSTKSQPNLKKSTPPEVQAMQRINAEADNHVFNSDLDDATQHIREAQLKRYHGSITIHFQNGVIGTFDKKEVILPKRRSNMGKEPA